MNNSFAETLGAAAHVTQSVIECISRDRLDEASHLVAQMHDAHPSTRDSLVLPVMIALKGGRLHDAWQLVNGLPDERHPELKALCLQLLGDPTWRGYAEAHENSDDLYVRAVMRALLGKPDDIAGHA
jgi:type III secretion protein HrpB1